MVHAGPSRIGHRTAIAARKQFQVQLLADAAVDDPRLSLCIEQPKHLGEADGVVKSNRRLEVIDPQGDMSEPVEYSHTMPVPRPFRALPSHCFRQSQSGPHAGSMWRSP